VEKNNNIQRIEQLTKKLKKAESIIKTISEIQGMYLVNKPKKEIFEKLLSLLLTQSNSEYGFIGEVLYDSENNPYLKTYAITNISWNNETRKFYEDNAPEGLEFKNLETLFGETLKTGKVVVANDPKNHEKAAGIPGGHPALNAYLGLPLYIDNFLIGMVGIANRNGGYSEDFIKEIEPITISISQLVFAQKKGCRECDR
jgi:GAF domain-containing protein